MQREQREDGKYRVLEREVHLHEDLDASTVSPDLAWQMGSCVVEPIESDGGSFQDEQPYQVHEQMNLPGPPAASPGYYYQLLFPL